MDTILATAHTLLRREEHYPDGSENWYDGNWFVTCDPGRRPNADVCVQGWYGYRLSLGAYAAFVAIFGLSFVAYVATYAVTRRGLAFTIALLLGVLCEILGYAGRLWSYNDPWNLNPFLMQICCLTLGPAFMAAGIYMCLRRIVAVFGRENSRIPPEYYTRIFIPCDVLSLILQAVGGGMASVAAKNGTSVDTGDNIMVAGLSFQVLTMLVFIILATDFAIRVRRQGRRGAAPVQSEAVRHIRNSFLFKACLVALALATVCIFWRCAYRVAELSKGWTGPLMKDQGEFIGFETIMIIVAVVALNVFHPSICFGAMMEGEGGFGAGRRKRAEGTSEGKAEMGNGEVVSDADNGKIESPA